uniref:(northern house mosquito) hypothetical protein n=2 Tax=Culex pipiens TaxID=7175 RepID=A0A8D8B783_CULPI
MHNLSVQIQRHIDHPRRRRPMMMIQVMMLHRTLAQPRQGLTHHDRLFLQHCRQAVEMVIVSVVLLLWLSQLLLGHIVVVQVVIVVGGGCQHRVQHVVFVHQRCQAGKRAGLVEEVVRVEGEGGAVRVGGARDWGVGVGWGDFVAVAVQQVHREVQLFVLFREGGQLEAVLAVVEPQHVRHVVVDVLDGGVLLVVRDEARDQRPHKVNKVADLLQHDPALVLFGEPLQQVEQMLVQIRRLFLLVLAGCARLPALPPFPLGRVVARVLLQVPLHPLAQVDLVAGRTPVLQRNGHFPLLNLDLLLLLLHRVERRGKIRQLFRRFRIRQQRRRQWRWRWRRIQRSRRLQPLLLHVLEEVVRVAGWFA